MRFSVGASIFLMCLPVFASGSVVRDIPAQYATPELIQVVTYFEALNAFPRPSHGEQAVRNYIASTAQGLGLEHFTDPAENLVVYVPGRGKFSRLSKTRAIGVQAHMDMVWDVKDLKPGEDINKYYQSGIPLEVTEGRYLQTKNTLSTNGADNGIGIAMMLRLMKSPPEDMPPLMLIFTADEEDTTVPASKFSAKIPSGFLIGLDNFFSDRIVIGCAGTRQLSGQRRLKTAERAGAGNLRVNLNFSGLLGGHSGRDIRLGRAHAVDLLREFLERINAAGVDYDVASLGAGRPPKGGQEIFNKIPKNFDLQLVISAGDLPKLETIKDGFLADFTAKYSAQENMSGIKFELSQEQIAASRLQVLAKGELTKILAMMQEIRSGVFTRISGAHYRLLPPPVAEQAVENSANFSFLYSDQDHEGSPVLHAGTMPRSFLNRNMDEFVAIHRKAFGHGGFAASESVLLTRDPAWEPVKGVLAKAAQRVKPGHPEPIKTLGFVELPYFIANRAAKEAVSIGVTIEFAHTYRERLDLASAGEAIRALDHLLLEVGKLSP